MTGPRRGGSWPELLRIGRALDPWEAEARVQALRSCRISKSCTTYTLHYPLTDRQYVTTNARRLLNYASWLPVTTYLRLPYTQFRSLDPTGFVLSKVGVMAFIANFPKLAIIIIPDILALRKRPGQIFGVVA